MSLEVVYRKSYQVAIHPVRRFDFVLKSVVLAVDFDPDHHLKNDGKWHAVITMPHEVVEHDGYGVPLWEGDPERRAWEEKQRLRHSNR